MLLKRTSFPIKMRDCNYFSSDVVVEPVDGVRVNEAVAGPQAGLHALLTFTQNLKKDEVESSFETIRL